MVLYYKYTKHNIECFSGVIVCTASSVVPEANPTPPLEFPSRSDNQDIRIIEATNTIINNLTKVSNLSNVNNNKLTTVKPTSKLPEEIKRQFNDDIFKSSSQPINVIAKISENYTGNYIENKYYTNHIEESWSSITLTLLVLTVMAIIILSCSALCLKKVEK